MAITGADASRASTDAIAEYARRPPRTAVLGSSRASTAATHAARLADALIADLRDDALRALAERMRPHLRGGPAHLLCVREAAAALRLHPDTVARMARTGRLPAVKVGREWRFRTDALTVGLSLQTPAPSRSRTSVRRKSPISDVAARAIRETTGPRR